MLAYTFLCEFTAHGYLYLAIQNQTLIQLLSKFSFLIVRPLNHGALYISMHATRSLPSKTPLVVLATSRLSFWIRMDRSTFNFLPWPISSVSPSGRAWEVLVEAK